MRRFTPKSYLSVPGGFWFLLAVQKEHPRRVEACSYRALQLSRLACSQRHTAYDGSALRAVTPRSSRGRRNNAADYTDKQSGLARLGLPVFALALFLLLDGSALLSLQFTLYSRKSP